MRPIIFVIMPVFMSIVVAGPLVSICTEINNRRALKVILASGFLYLSAVVGNVLEPALNSLLYGDFYSDGGIIGFAKKVAIMLAIYFFIIICLPTIIKFKSRKHRFAYIFTAVLIYGILFNYFLLVF